MVSGTKRNNQESMCEFLNAGGLGFPAAGNIEYLNRMVVQPRSESLDLDRIRSHIGRIGARN